MATNITRTTTSTSFTYSASEFSTDKEKVWIEERERVNVPETIKEDDGDNVGLEQYKQAQQGPEITPAQNRQILRRIDLILLPIFLVTQTLQYIDKTALNYANLFGMSKVLGMSGSQYSTVASMFYVGYLIAQEPFGILLGKYPAGRVLGTSCVVWGIAVLTMASCFNFAGALVNRLFMGMFEAAVTPGLSLMTGFWWTRQEIPLRQTLWYTAVGWGGVIGGLMAAGISKINEATYGGPPRWQLIFYILGSITIAWGVFLFFFLSDSPGNAKFLNQQQRILAVGRVANNATGIKSKKFKREHMWAALKDPKSWCLTIAMLGSSIPNGILTNFSSIIITDMGFSDFHATLLDCAGRSLQIISLIIAGTVATFFPNTRLLMATAGNIICVIGSATMAYLPESYTWGRLVSFWLINTQSVGFALGLVMISSNTAGYTKKQVTSALVFAAYCIGNIIGPYMVFDSEAPRYRSASIAMLASYSAKLFCHALLGVIMYGINKRRDAKYGPPDAKRSADAGMRDETEYENKDFRFVL